MRKFLLLLAIPFSMMLVPAAPALAVLDESELRREACESVTFGEGNACVDEVGGLDSILKTILDILSVIVGVAAVIMIIIAGLKYTTSGGDSSKTAAAKGTLVYAIVGLIVVALAQFIVWFVLDAV